MLAAERFVRFLLLALAAYGVWRFRSAQAFAASGRALAWISVAVLAYPLLELAEAVGSWMLLRWGEYVAVVGTGISLPLEVYDLTEKVTVTRVVAFVIDLSAVANLLWSKRLFGLRGGKAAPGRSARACRCWRSNAPRPACALRPARARGDPAEGSAVSSACSSGGEASYTLQDCSVAARRQRRRQPAASVHAGRPPARPRSKAQPTSRRTLPSNHQ